MARVSARLNAHNRARPAQTHTVSTVSGVSHCYMTTSKEIFSESRVPPLVTEEDKPYLAGLFQESGGEQGPTPLQRLHL